MMLKFATTIFFRGALSNKLFVNFSKAVRSKSQEEISEVRTNESLRAEDNKVYGDLSEYMADLIETQGKPGAEVVQIIKVLSNSIPQNSQELSLYLKFKNLCAGQPNLLAKFKDIDKKLNTFGDSRNNIDDLINLFCQAATSKSHSLAKQWLAKIQESFLGGIGDIIIDKHKEGQNYGGGTDMNIKSLLKLIKGMSLIQIRGKSKISKTIQEITQMFLYKSSDLEPLDLALLVKHACSCEYSITIQIQKGLQLSALLNNAIKIARSRIFEMKKDELMLYIQSAVYLNPSCNFDSLLQEIQTRIYQFGNQKEHRSFYSRVLSLNLKAVRQKNVSLFNVKAITLMLETLATSFQTNLIEKEAASFLRLFDSYSEFEFNKISLLGRLKDYNEQKQYRYISGLQFFLKVSGLSTNWSDEHEDALLAAKNNALKIRFQIAKQQTLNQQPENIALLDEQIQRNMKSQVLLIQYLEGLSKTYLQGTQPHRKYCNIALQNLLKHKIKITNKLIYYLSHISISEQYRPRLIQWLKENEISGYIEQSKGSYWIQNIFSREYPTLNQLNFFYNIALSVINPKRQFVVEFILFHKRSLILSSYRFNFQKQFLKNFSQQTPILTLVKALLTMKSLNISDSDEVAKIIVRHPQFFKRKNIYSLITTYLKQRQTQESQKPKETKQKGKSIKPAVKKEYKEKLTQVQKMIDNVNKNI